LQKRFSERKQIVRRSLKPFIISQPQVETTHPPACGWRFMLCLKKSKPRCFRLLHGATFQC
jgi:hypothetical protein